MGWLRAGLSKQEEVVGGLITIFTSAIHDAEKPERASYVYESSIDSAALLLTRNFSSDTSSSAPTKSCQEGATHIGTCFTHQVAVGLQSICDQVLFSTTPTTGIPPSILFSR